MQISPPCSHCDSHSLNENRKESAGMEDGARESSTDSETKDNTSYHLTAMVSNKAITDTLF